MWPALCANTVVAASATTAAAATIEVVPPVDSIVVAPGEATTVPDAQLTMRATLLDVGGDTLADRPVAWAPIELGRAS